MRKSNLKRDRRIYELRKKKLGWRTIGKALGLAHTSVKSAFNREVERRKVMIHLICKG